MVDLELCFEYRHHGEHLRRILKDLDYLPGGPVHPAVSIFLAIVCLAFAAAVRYLS